MLLTLKSGTSSHVGYPTAITVEYLRKQDFPCPWACGGKLFLGERSTGLADDIWYLDQGVCTAVKLVTVTEQPQRFPQPSGMVTRVLCPVSHALGRTRPASRCQQRGGPRKRN